MPILNEQLKNLIQDKHISPDSTQKIDIQPWLKTWVDFCFQAFSDGALNASYHAILDRVVAQKSLDELKGREIYHSSFLDFFFTDLLLACNEEFQWFEQQGLDLKETRNTIRNHVSYHRLSYLSQKTLDNDYHFYLKGWFEEKFKTLSEHSPQSLSCKQAFEVFWQAYNSGFFGKEEFEHVFTSEIVEYQADTIKICQNNGRIIWQYFIEYMTKNNFLAEPLEVMEHTLLSGIESHEKTNEMVNDFMWNRIDGGFNAQNLLSFIGQPKVNKRDTLFIHLHASNQFNLKDKKKLMDLIEKAKFKTIKISNEKADIFSFSDAMGVTVNDDILDSEQCSKVVFSIQLAHYEKQVFDEYQLDLYARHYSSTMESRLQRLAEHIVKDVNDEFALDDKIPFSQFGESGINIYFSFLNEKFVNELKKNKLDKGYSVFLPARNVTDHASGLKMDAIQGMNNFLNRQFEKNRDYIFCCHKMNICVNDNHSGAYIEALANLIQLLDKAKLNQLVIHITDLELSYAEILSKALHTVTHTLIRFEGPLSIEQALLLESINDEKLGPVVPFIQQNNESNVPIEHHISKQPAPVNLAKIQALMDGEIELRPIQGKIGLQNQHHYQQQTQKKTEVNILQSWQIDQAKETQQQSNQRYHYLSKDEENHLISWHVIQAACNPELKNHQEMRLMLGEEIINYQYKGRDLIDLWKRLTGHIKLTGQDRVPDASDEIGSLLQHFSPLIPKRVSKKALLAIVRHPHLFQDGVHLKSLPPSFGFSENDGALFIHADSDKDEKPNPFMPVFSSMSQAALPMAQHFDCLENSAIPSQAFYGRLTQSISRYYAWQYWRRSFTALNTFNQQGIEALIQLCEHCTQEKGVEVMSFYDYFIQALNYYHYHKIANRQQFVEPNQIQFEYQQREDDKQGVIHTLAQDSIERLPKNTREYIHKALVDILNRDYFCHDKAMDEHEKDAYKELLLSVLGYHQDKLPDEIRHSLIDETGLSLLMEIIGWPDNIKFAELALGHHCSIVCNIFVMLENIYLQLGEAAVRDFTHCFISPIINISYLGDAHQQQALTQLLQLSEVQYHWWQQLTLQHIEQSGFADFAVLMSAFQFFLNELEALDIKDNLSLPCPLQGINNLQVSLNRVIDVLKKVKKPAEQMYNLHNLDWSACGVIYAVNKMDYQFVNADMRLDLEFESEFNEFRSALSYDTPYQIFDHYGAKPFSEKKINKINTDKREEKCFELALPFFYRYIGFTKYAAPMIVYEQLVDAISLPGNCVIIDEITCISKVNDHIEQDGLINIRSHDEATILTHLLTVIAYATTGKRQLDRLPQEQQQRVKQLKEFVRAVYECAYERSYDVELDQLLVGKKAVAYQSLVSLLKGCVHYCSYRPYFQLDNNMPTKYGIDLQELTLIMKLIKLSVDHYYKLIQDNFNFICKIKNGTKGWAFGGGSEILVISWDTKTILNKYGQYFIDAINRIQAYHPESDYSCFLKICMNLKEQSFSFDNTGRLIRIISLIFLKIENILDDERQITLFLQKLSLYQEKAGTNALDKLLSHLCCIVPDIKQSFEFEQLHSFVEHCINGAEDTNNLDRSDFESYFSGYRIDPYLDEVNDVDFYATPDALEEKFAGLGMFFAPVKAVVLQYYPVSIGDDKANVWKDFLHIIQQMENSEQQHQILQALLQSNHQSVDLNTLNSWLKVLLRSNNKVRFDVDYFKALSPVLLKHKDKDLFVNKLNEWWDFSGSWFSKVHHTGLITVLNSLAAIDRGSMCLGSLYTAASAFAWMSSDEDYPWYNDFIKLINFVERKNIAIESLDEVLSNLHNFYHNAGEEKQRHNQFKSVLLRWLFNIEQTFDITLSFTKQWDDINPRQALNQMMILAHVTDLDLTWVYQALAKMAPEQQALLASCYQFKPVPAARLLKSLIENRITIEGFIAEHTRDPHHERNMSKLKQQFDNNILWSYINRAKYLNPHQSKELDFSQQLYDQLKFVNHIGYEEVRHLSLQEIQQRLHKCRHFLADASNNEERLTTYLTALSLLREAIYKTSLAPAVLWPSAVQMLGVLSTLNHQLSSTQEQNANPLFMQMATGEGKSLLAVMLAILTWLKGQPVTVVTHRASLASRDARAYSLLFESLEIECEHLTADKYRERFFWKNFLKNFSEKDKDVPEFSGIYYAEFNDLALMRQQRLLDRGVDIDKMSFIIDEGDEIILHNQIDNNLTQTIGDYVTHTHGWAFEALAAYLDNAGIEQDSLTVSMTDLVGYLRRAYPMAVKACQQVDFLVKLPIYLQAAWQARTLKEGVDFIPKLKQKVSDEYYAAILLNDKPMPPNVSYNGLIQQALHGRLNHQSKMRQSPHHFPVPPETTLFSTLNPEAILHWMKERGSVIALSATIGSNSELMEMQQNYGFDYIKLPKMQNSLRVEYPARFCQDQEKQFLSIAEICQYHTGERTQSKSRAILIPVENIEVAEKLNQYIKEYSQDFSPRLLHAGLDDISDEMLSELERQSGRSGHILIAVTGLISRGFDIKLSSANQVVVITTYLKNGVDEIQVKGRCSRVNQTTGSRDKGKFYAVYDLEKEGHRYPYLNIDINDIDINPEGFKQRHFFAHYQRESTLRLHRQLVGISKAVIQEHFFVLWEGLFKNNEVMTEMRDKVMAAFTAALEKIASIVPVEDFSIMTEQGVEARREYNRTLAAIYKESLESMRFILAESFPEVIEDTAPFLLEKMDYQQLQLLDNYKKALVTGADQPAIKVYKAWKEGVKYNAYLDAGRQGMGNYMLEKFKAWRLTRENKIKIEAEKSALEQKLTCKKLKKSDFLSQLKQIANIDINNDLFHSLLNIYHEEMGPLKEEPVLDNNGMDGSQIESIQQVCGKNKTITFMHDPLIGKACEIRATSDSLSLFGRLQKAIDEAYETCQIKSPIHFCITTLDKQEPCLYQVVLDFSSHSLDAIDRQQLLSIVAGYFDVDVKPLFNTKYIPSLQTMQNVLIELKEQMYSSMKYFPADFKKLFQYTDNQFLRRDYDENVFEIAVKLLEKHYSKLSSQVKISADALLNYSQPLHYQNHRGSCQAYPPAFDNLSELVENDRKRDALCSINKEMRQFRKNTFSDSLLFRQQEECLLRLSAAIVDSPAGDTLTSIYQRWQEKKIQYLEKTITIGELMQLRKEQSSFFGKSRSPDVLIICQQIESRVGLSQSCHIGKDL